MTYPCVGGRLRPGRRSYFEAEKKKVVSRIGGFLYDPGTALEGVLPRRDVWKEVQRVGVRAGSDHLTLCTLLE